jgi:hypothetical protein
MIKALKSLLNDWTEVQPERAQMAELLVTLYKQERLDVPIAQAYEASAYAYSIIGDEYKTMTWASKAVEAMTVLYGDDHPLTKDLEVLMLNPTEHRTWRYQAPKEDTVEESGSGTESAAESSSSKWGFF